MGNPLTGHCYTASEMAYHLLGGKDAGWKPMNMQWEGTSHWFLKHESGLILDITAGQFASTPDYSQAVGRGFLTKRPCQKTRVAIATLSRIAR